MRGCKLQLEIYFEMKLDFQIERSLDYWNERNQKRNFMGYEDNVIDSLFRFFEKSVISYDFKYF